MIYFFVAQGDWKLLVGDVAQAGWTGPRYPNASTDWLSQHTVRRCTVPAAGKRACLYDLARDPGEHVDLAARQPARTAAMLRALWAHNATAYLPDRGADDGAACVAALARGHYWGPFT